MLYQMVASSQEHGCPSFTVYSPLLTSATTARTPTGPSYGAPKEKFQKRRTSSAEVSYGSKSKRRITLANLRYISV